MWTHVHIFTSPQLEGSYVGNLLYTKRGETKFLLLSIHPSIPHSPIYSFNKNTLRMYYAQILSYVSNLLSWTQMNLKYLLPLCVSVGGSTSDLHLWRGRPREKPGSSPALEPESGARWAGWTSLWAKSWCVSFSHQRSGNLKRNKLCTDFDTE